MRDNNRELGILRGMALWAVVGIHTFSIGVSNVETGSLGYWGYKYTHTLLQFAVPCFLLLAAILMTYNLGSQKLKLLEFYKKKSSRILVPYIVWTIIYVFPKALKGWIPLDSLWSADSWIYWLLWGKGHDHLYYMSVMIQLCLLTPLIIVVMRLVMRYTRRYSGAVITIGAAITQVLLYMIYKKYIFRVIGSSGTLIISYAFIIIMGIYIGFNYESVMSWIEKRVIIFITIGVITAGIYMSLMRNIVNGVKISTTFYQMNWYIYTFVISIILLLLARWIKEFKIAKYIEWMGKYSFGIYLMHPIITFFLRKYVTITNPIILLVIIICSQIGIIVGCGFVTKIMGRYKLTAFMIGEKRYSSKN